MTYKEFKNAYAWTLKNYHGTHELYFSDFETRLIGKCIETKFEKRGNKWIEKEHETFDVTPRFYFNVVDAIPFFRNMGGNERVSCGYCVRGYVPLEIVSLSPDRMQKTIRKFKLF